MAGIIDALNGNGMSLQFEETLAQVERWRQILGGMREAESELWSRTADESATFALNAFIQV